jgi:putative SOS response-associated peptidase YedK
MCYDLAYFTKKIEKYEKRFGVHYGETPPAPVFHANGFDHLEVPVITHRLPDTIQLFTWGLIPFWVKDLAHAAKIQNSTLNARDNTLFEKSSFREAAKRRRCLVLVDAFYDHHWHNGKSYPFLIRMKDGEPFALGGLWERWKREDVERFSVTVITTDPNPMLAYIHNQPRASETPRMPYIVPRDLEKVWMEPELPSEDVLGMIGPYPQEEMESFTVGRLRGKAYAGNVPEIMQPFRYPELDDSGGSLF